MIFRQTHFCRTPWFWVIGRTGACRSSLPRERLEDCKIDRLDQNQTVGHLPKRYAESNDGPVVGAFLSFGLPLPLLWLCSLRQRMAWSLLCRSFAKVVLFWSADFFGWNWRASQFFLISCWMWPFLSALKIHMRNPFGQAFGWFHFEPWLGIWQAREMTRPMAQELGPGLTLRGDFLGIHSPYGIDMIVLSMFIHN